MPSLPFVKMHGLGNDFILIDGIAAGKAGLAHQKKFLTPKFARKLCDRRLGIGADQILWILPAKSKSAIARMEVINADGSRAEMCGNGIRAVALYLDRTLPKSKRKKIYPVETEAGVLEVKVQGSHARVNMGVPKPGSSEERLNLSSQALTFLDVNVGNPHAVIFVEDPASYPAAKVGPELEKHPRFPERTNVEFVRPENEHRLTARVWERGAGLTLACGTGACAAAVAAISQKRCKSPVQVKLPGGVLKIEWAGLGSPVFMSGPAEEVYRGEWSF